MKYIQLSLRIDWNRLHQENYRNTFIEQEWYLPRFGYIFIRNKYYRTSRIHIEGCEMIHSHTYPFLNVSVWTPFGINQSCTKVRRRFDLSKQRRSKMCNLYVNPLGRYWTICPNRLRMRSVGLLSVDCVVLAFYNWFILYSFLDFVLSRQRLLQDGQFIDLFWETVGCLIYNSVT